MNNSILSFLRKNSYVLFIFFVILFFYFPFIIGKSFIWEDGLYIFYPGLNYFASSLREGRFPFWIQGVRIGMPFYSDVQMGVFYPLNFILSFFVKNGTLPFEVYQLYIVFHLCLASLVMYLLLKKLEVEKIFAVLGSIVFVFSGYLSLHIIHLAFFEVVIWAPIVLFLIIKRFERENFQIYFWIVLAILITFLPGSPQISLYFSYFFILFWIYLFFVYHYKKENFAEFFKKFLVEILKIAGVYMGVFFIGSVFFCSFIFELVL